MIYSFKCSEHGEFDASLNPNGQDSLREQNCPKCKCMAPRIYQNTPSHFKGKGFFTTDNPGAKKCTI